MHESLPASEITADSQEQNSHLFLLLSVLSYDRKQAHGRGIGANAARNERPPAVHAMVVIQVAFVERDATSHRGSARGNAVPGPPGHR